MSTFARSRRARAVLALPAIALAVVTVAGCGSNSGKAAASTSAAPASGASGSAASGANGFTAYLTCMSQHGVTIPTGRPGGGFGGGARPSGAPRSRGAGGGFGDLTSTTGPNAAAAKACASLRPTGGGGFGGGANSSAIQSELAAYRSCLSDHGVTLATPSPAASGAPASAGGGRRGGGLGALNTADPKVAAAVKACAALRPTFSRPGGASPTPSATPNT